MKFKTVYYNGHIIPIDFKNDIIFKLLLSSEDSLPFLEFVINACTNKQYTNLRIVRNEDDGTVYGEKTSFFDIIATDEEGKDVIVEMQNSVISSLQLSRFQVYGFKTIVKKATKGKDYSMISTVDIIVITSEEFRNQLYSNGSYRWEDGQTIDGNLVYFHIISLPFINEIIKGKEALSNLEMLCFMLENGDPNGIINIVNDNQKEMIDFMETKYNSVFDNGRILTPEEEHYFIEMEKRETNKLINDLKEKNAALEEQVKILENENAQLKTQYVEIGSQYNQILSVLKNKEIID